MTVRAAIIGLGRWGRSLVNAVHGKTEAIKFVAAYTRTRASAEDFCRPGEVLERVYAGPRVHHEANQASYRHPGPPAPPVMQPDELGNIR